jgi:hypothetical protein
MDQPKVGIYNSTCRMFLIVWKIEELCEDARLTAVEKIRQISEQATNAREPCH